VTNQSKFIRIGYLKLDIGYSRQRRAGFTVVELIIYMGILTVLISVLTTVFASIIEVQLESKATSSVDQDGRYILSRLIYDTQSATTIASPSAGIAGTVLKLTKGAENYTYKLDTSGNLQLTNNSGTNNLNSVDTSISNLTFQTIGSASSSANVQMKFTVTSTTQRTSGPKNEVRVYQTTLGLN
jgi:hypothetical protein